MTTDGGGYTSYPITGGISANRYDQANSCQELGLQMVIPRIQAHLNALFNAMGFIDTEQLVARPLTRVQAPDPSTRRCLPCSRPGECDQ